MPSRRLASPLLALLLALPLGCGEADEIATAQTSTTQGGAAGAGAGGLGQGGVSGKSGQSGAGGQGSAGQAGAGSSGSSGQAGSGGAGGAGGSGGAGAGQGGSSGSSGQAGAGGEAGQGLKCEGFQVTGAEIGVGAASDLSGVATFDLARVGASQVFVLATSEEDPKISFSFAQMASFGAGVWPAGDVGPFVKVDSVPMYDLALVPATEQDAAALILPITNSGSFWMRSVDPVTFAQKELGVLWAPLEPSVAALVARRPGGFVGVVGSSFAQPGKPLPAYAVRVGDDGSAAAGQQPISCGKGDRVLLSGFHREGETVVFTASESSACQGDTPNLRLLTIADGDDTLTPVLKHQFPAPPDDLYEGVFAADAGGGATWLVSRQLGLGALVQPPAQVVLLDAGGGEALQFEIPGDQLITRSMAVTSLAGNLLVAIPDASLEGQGTILVRLYNQLGQIAGETTVGTPLAFGGPFPFIARVRLLPLDDASFVVAYQARPEPGQPSTVRLSKITCFGQD